MASLHNRSTVLLFLLVLAACGQQPKVDVSLDLSELLGSEDSKGFTQALEVRDLRFPDDHGAHDDFRNEWWYLTGNLEGTNGRRFGYQVTFFRTGLPADPAGTNAPGGGRRDERDARSAWRINNVWMAHVAITDIDRHTHLARQRFSRENPGLAGARINPFTVWLDDWQLRSEGNDFPWQLQIETDAFSLHLALDALKGPVLQGDRGLSRKSHTPGNASYYYSYPRLATTGSLRTGGEEVVINGLSWFDREWSTSTLDRQQSGWNWFSLQLDSGEDMMFYQLLDLQGNADANSAGSWIDANGLKTSLSNREIQLTVVTEWRSDYGQQYPVKWRLDYPQQGKSWIISAAVEDQFMDLAVKYWEGAVDVFDSSDMKKIGHGYLEMTRTR